MDHPFIYGALVFLVGIVFPLYGLREGPKIRSLLTARPDDLVQVYRSTIIFLVILAGAVLIAMRICGDAFAEIGFRLPDPTWLTAGLFLLFFILAALLVSLKYSDAFLERTRNAHAEVLYLLPKNPEEYKWSVGASFAAGICEEVLYRGFLFWQLTFWMPVIPAVILTNLAFGVAHFGTGLKNAGGAFLLGLAFSAVSIPFHSLLPAMIAHTLVDLYAATLVYRSYR